MKVSVDHVHVFVADQYAAAAWYERVLGLKIVKEHEDWAVGGGPLTISGDDGKSGIALFARPSEKSVNQSTVAFGVSGDEFAEFIGRLGELDLKSLRDERVTAENISDHDKSWSIYFFDPDSNPIEVTTYDYDLVKERLGLG
jgi:catechol 2,3-dioxygenase-like lactoylglutathione lyase family enzyme